jgi:hypothetical protein
VAIAYTSQHDDARQRAEWDLTQYCVIRVERFLGPLERVFRPILRMRRYPQARQPAFRQNAPVT